MVITAALVKELREMSGSGMMDCKRALQANDGDIQKAMDWLREQGMGKADKKASRVAAEGVVTSYIHGNGRIGVLIEVNIETDFAAKNEDFQEFARMMAMQVAAMNPKYVVPEEIPAEILEHEKEVVRNQALNEGKPAKVVDERIVPGRLEKYYAEVCLMNQTFIRDDSKTCDQVRRELIAKIGENVVVRRFVRFELGEGIEKKEENFAEEVMKQMK